MYTVPPFRVSVDFSKSCGWNETVTSAVSVISPEHNYKLLPNCLKCELLFIAETGYQLSAAFSTFGTDAGRQGQCNKNRMDVYNGDGVNTTQLLSSKQSYYFCPPPFRRKAEGHSFRHSVLPSFRPSFRPSVLLSFRPSVPLI